MKIVPALLAEDFDEFLARLKQAESFTDYVQIDLMDGSFVPTRSFGPERLNELNASLTFEVHLMVQKPSEFLSQITNPKLRKVIFHVEVEENHSEIIREIERRRLTAGIALKPETGIDDLGDISSRVQSLLFLTVDPCCYGNPFRPEVLDKVAKARAVFPDKAISVDGGVSLDNLKTFMGIGVDSVCVGSRIFLHGDPKENYRRFAERLRELQGG